MTTPVEELAAAVAGRQHWTYDGGAALYAPPGVSASVRVRPVVNPQRRRESWAAIVLVGATAERMRPCWNVHEAITWAESIPL